MKEWNEQAKSVSKITPDLEKARALLKLIQLREKNIEIMADDMITLVVESYYEIIKELITGIMSADGYKTVSHEMLIAYVARFYPEFSSSKIMALDQLRKLRNEIAYRGVLIKPEYLERNKEVIMENISKLKTILLNKMK